MTWQAVVFDIMAKIHELHLAGEAQATVLVAEIEQMKSEPKKAQEFEANIFEKSKGLELLSHLEREDLDRLRLDRHRCAHPSIHDPTSDYQPTPELARSHLRNIVEHLLSRPPVAGKSALDKLKKLVDLPTFPIDEEEALVMFRCSPLQRAKNSVVREFFFFLMQRILIQTGPVDQHVRDATAISALYHLHPEQCELFLGDEVDKFVDYARNQGSWSVLWLVDVASRISTLADHLSDGSLLSIKHALLDSNLQNRAPMWERIAKIPRLDPWQQEFVKSLEYLDFVRVCERNPGDIRLKDRAFSELLDAGSYSGANKVGHAFFIPAAHLLSEEDLEQLFQIAGKNDQVGASQALKDLAKLLVDSGQLETKGLKKLIESNCPRPDSLRRMMMLSENYEPKD